MKNFRVESIRLNADYDRAFRYIADPTNLPAWTHAFKSVQNGKAVMATPGGSMEVSLNVKASVDSGTIDWSMLFPDGTPAFAHSRLVRDSARSCVYSFILLAPPVPLEQLEGSLNQQAQILRDELQKLSTLLESRRATV
jgi:hypothetical protein